MTKGPETMAFFIDTSASADPVEEKNDVEDPQNVGESILGAKESEAKQKLRERAATERKLASFLFGNPSANAAKEIKRDESDTETSSDEESDDLEEGEDAIIDSDSDAENNVNTVRTAHDEDDDE